MSKHCHSLATSLNRDISADPVKGQVVVNWHVPPDHKKLQHFLGFANFYHRFIWDFSRIALPLTPLTSPKVLSAQNAFTHLKEHFASTPIVLQMD